MKQPRHVSIRHVLAVAAVVVMAGQTESAMTRQVDGENLLVTTQRVVKAERFDVSPPLRDLAQTMPTVTEREEEERFDDPPSGLEGPLGPQTPDAAVQREAPGGGEMPTLIQNFEGVGNNDGVAPPDTNGDVGPNHYVQMVNLSYAVFSKTGTLLVGPSKINTLWAGFGGACQTENAGDPVVLYDQLADRWLLSQFTAAGPNYYLCVALSTSGDPTGSYYRWAFGTGTNFPDYPKFGVWTDYFIATTREFLNTGPFGGVGVYGLNKADMMAGNASPRVVSSFINASSEPYIGDGLLPSDIDGRRLPPAGSPSFLLGSLDNGGPYGATSDAIAVIRFYTNFTTMTSSATLPPSHLLATAAFDSMFPCGGGRSCIPQPGTANKVDHQGYRQRVIHRAAYRNFGDHDAIVTNQSVESAGSISGVRWYEIRTPDASPTIYQQSTYQPDSVHRWFGSIAMDKMGNMAVGYSVSDGTSVYPGIRIAGRLAGDTLSTLPQAERVMMAGTGSETSTQRWGDYSAMTIDPVDDCTFWFTTEYYQTSGAFNWHTRVGSFRFPSCRRESGLDVTGDGYDDFVVYRQSTGSWYVAGYFGGTWTYTWGASTDKQLKGDFDGDGKMDIAVWRPSTGVWYILKSSSGFASSMTFTWGITSDIPVPADYDGDGAADPAVFRPSTGTWYILNSGSNYTTSSSRTFGAGTDRPVPGDYDGDGKADIAVWRPSTGMWYYYESGSTMTGSVSWGANGDLPVPGDYDGDNKVDIAVWRPATGVWYVKLSGGGTLTRTWGALGDIPVLTDSDGDGKADMMVFRPSNGYWYRLQSSGGFVTGLTSNITWGTAIDAPPGSPRPGPDAAKTGDLDGDRRSDLTVWRGSTGYWYVLRSGTEFTGWSSYVWGSAGDVPVPGDYDGDGKNDVVIWRPSTGAWYIKTSSSGFGSWFGYYWGANGDVPVPGDFDGDGKTDIAVWRESTGAWYILKSSTGFATWFGYTWGGVGDVPVVGDYDGDGMSDIAVWRPSTGAWYILKSSTGFASSMSYTWGGSIDTAVPGDYDGDGKTDIAVWRASTGVWYILKSGTGFSSSMTSTWGSAGMTAVPGDYDGDGITDLVVWRGSTGTWYIRTSSSGFVNSMSFTWGASGDTPLLKRE